MQQGLIFWADLGPNQRPVVRLSPPHTKISALRWSTYALTAVSTAASKMCSLIGFPHYQQALWGRDPLPLHRRWSGDSDGVGSGLALLGRSISC